MILYASYRDLTVEFKEQEQIRRQYRELILQHYRTPGPNALIVGTVILPEARLRKSVIIRTLAFWNALERRGMHFSQAYLL